MWRNDGTHDEPDYKHNIMVYLYINILYCHALNQNWVSMNAIIRRLVVHCAFSEQAQSGKRLILTGLYRYCQKWIGTKYANKNRLFIYIIRRCQQLEISEFVMNRRL